MFSQTQSYFDFFSELEFLNGEKALSINYFPTKFVSPDKLVYSEKLVSQRSVEKRRTVLKNNVNGLIVAEIYYCILSDHSIPNYIFMFKQRRF